MTFEEVNLQNSVASLIPGEVLSVSDAGSGYEPHQRCDAKIYICATMWHETEAEMEELVESLLRCDADPFVNGYNFNSNDKSKETYQLKAHIVFDDALVPAKCVPGHSTINSYAQSLLNVLNRLVKSPNHRYTNSGAETAYGHCIVCALPNGSTLYLHLKDKTKVRNKKRWSQVMYMCYIISSLHPSDMYNAYILAVDGDVSFLPADVIRLAQALQTKREVGAICGRIYPTGSGLVLWFQEVEYAISHWLYKSTEALVGTVLCCPGCFTMYRASALNSNGLLTSYASNTKNAIDHLMHDQGEDRWLTTLVLKSGYQTSYCADARANTHAPESLPEFYRQRRRWCPSTLCSNIFLLKYSRQLLSQKINMWWFLLYHLLLLITGFLTPGIVIAVIVQGMVVAQETTGISSDKESAVLIAVVAAGVPITFFILICLSGSEKWQFRAAKALTALYIILSFVTMLGAVGTLCYASAGTPSAFLLWGYVAPCIIAVLLHPEDMNRETALLMVIYIIGAPSYFVVCLIYALCKMDDISWGTRESLVTEQPKVPVRKNATYRPIGNVESELRREIAAVCLNPLRLIKNLAENMCRRHVFSFGQQQKTDDVMFGLTDIRTDPLEPRNSCYNCSAERTIDAFTGKLTKTRLHLSEEHLWRTIAAKYLSPEKTQRHHTHTVRKQMTRLRNVVILLLVVLNVAYITLMIGYDMDQTSHIMWYFNGDTKVSPMYVLSITIQSVLLIVQIVSMLIYRRQVFAALWNRVVSISVFRWKFFCRQSSRSKISECNVV